MIRAGKVCHGLLLGSMTIIWSLLPTSLTAQVHPNVPLRDRLGNNINSTSQEPYSPRKSCGLPCHDVDAMTNAYHFQQGRTNLAGDFIMADDFFNDGREFIKSPGMFGKW